MVQIYFKTATYDEIERDVKVTLEAQLGLIGGTMGLFTGFSILSGVEIIYYVIKFFMSLRTSRKDAHLNHSKAETNPLLINSVFINLSPSLNQFRIFM